MVDLSPVLALFRALSASAVLLLGANAQTTTLVLLGTTALAVAVVALLARGVRTLTLDVASLAPARVRDAAQVRPFATQCDPDAPGRARPRAPGLFLG